jgi:oligoendopeptidase F
MAEKISSPQPPRYSEKVAEDLRNIYLWAHQWFKATVIEQRLASRIDKVAAITTLTQTISASPTKAEIEAIQAKINEIINASK